MLQDRPDLGGKVVFLALLVPTRESVPEYAQYKDQTFQLITVMLILAGRTGSRSTIFTVTTTLAPWRP